MQEKLGLYGLRDGRGRLGRDDPGARQCPSCATSSPSSRAPAAARSSFLAHRDNNGAGPGANDNASGTGGADRARPRLRAASARSRAGRSRSTRSSSSRRTAARSAASAPSGSPRPRRSRGTVRAVVSLDGLAGAARPRLEMAGFAPRSPAPALVRTADVRVAAQLGRPPARPGWLAQLVDLGMPFGYGEQAPFLGREISAIRLDDGGRRRRRRDDRHDGEPRPGRSSSGSGGRRSRSSRRSTAAIELAGGDGGLRLPRVPGRSRLGARARLPGRARPVPRRRDRPLRPDAGGGGCTLPGAWRALRTRLGVWLWVGLRGRARRPCRRLPAGLRRSRRRPTALP